MADETVKLRHTAAQVDDGIDKANAAAPKSTVYTKTEVDTALAAKADSYDVYDKDAVDDLLEGKVDVETGKGLSTNDYTNAEKTKLANLENYDDTEVKASIASVRNTAEETAQEVEDARGTYTSLGERLDDMGGGGGGGTSNYNQLTNKPSINGVTLAGNKTTSDLGIVENAQADWSQTDSTADDYIKNKPTIPTVNDATLTIQKNGTEVGTFSANAATAATINITVPVDAEDVDALPDTTKYGASLALSIDSSTYVVTATLKDQDGNALGTAQTIDLPLETVVVGGSYDDTTKKVILTLKNGTTIDFSVADLVAGLQTEITSTNKLDADLVDDTTSVHKFVTAADKTAWNAKSDFSGSYNDLTNKPTIPAAQVNADWNAGSGVAQILNKPTIPTVDQSYSASSTNAQSGVAIEGKKPGLKTTGTKYTIDGQTVTAGTGAEVFNDYTYNKASGNYSHAEGDTTTASGSYAHAEGLQTTASGEYSHAEGLYTTASGTGSHAEGIYTTAASRGQHVQGTFNVEDTNGTYAFIIGNGTAYNALHNAFAIDWNGLIYVNGATTGVDVSQCITPTDYATQNTGGTIKAWTTTDGSDTILHLATQ